MQEARRMRHEFYTDVGTGAFRLTASSKPPPILHNKYRLFGPLSSTIVHQGNVAKLFLPTDDSYPYAHRSLVCKRVCRIHVEMQRKAQEMK